MHRHDRLELNAFQRSLFQVSTVEDIFPEYYILKVNKFDDVARDGLDQWVYFLKNGAIKRDFTGRGLKEAQAALDIMRLSESERRAYASHIDGPRIDIGVAQSTIVRAESAARALEEAENRVQEEWRQKEEERRQKDEERPQKEEERCLKEEERRQKEAALLEIEELRRQLTLHKIKKS